jgi:hypothetical protein
MDWVLKPEVKILIIGIKRVKLVLYGFLTSLKDKGVIYTIGI